MVLKIYLRLFLVLGFGEIILNIKEKIVIVPKSWFKNVRNSVDRCSIEWIKI